MRRLSFMRRLGVAGVFLIATVVPAFGDQGGFDTAPWIDDLREVRAGMLDKYANFEWAVFEREVNLAALFDETESRLRDAGSDAEAKAIIDRAIRSIGDGHLRVKWPEGSARASAAAAEVCGPPGYDARMRERPAAGALPSRLPCAVR